MKVKPRICDFMATALVTLAPDTEINRAMKTLLDARVSGAPVLDDNGQLVGFLSKKDCLKSALGSSYHQAWGGTVADHMSSPVETLEADLELVRAAETFIASHFRPFPITRDGRLVGQISRTDVLRGLMKNWQ